MVIHVVVATVYDQYIVEIYSVSAEKIISDAFHCENV